MLLLLLYVSQAPRDLYVSYCTHDQISGVDHLLYSGRGAGGRSHEGEAEELHVACFMGLVSYLAGRLDVLRVSPRHAERLLNAVARSIIQSATVTDTALTDAGLDGTGEVIQVRRARITLPGSAPSR